MRPECTCCCLDHKQEVPCSDICCLYNSCSSWAFNPCSILHQRQHISPTQYSPSSPLSHPILGCMLRLCEADMIGADPAPHGLHVLGCTYLVLFKADHWPLSSPPHPKTVTCPDFTPNSRVCRQKLRKLSNYNANFRPFVCVI